MYSVGESKVCFQNVSYLGDAQVARGGAPALDEDPLPEGAQVAGAPVRVYEHHLAAGQVPALVHGTGDAPTALSGTGINSHSRVQ